MNKTMIKKYAVTGFIALLSITLLNRIAAAAPIRKIVYGGGRGGY